MQWRLWQAEAGARARHRLGLSFRPEPRALAAILVVVATAMPGCAPMYHDTVYSVSEEEEAGPRRPPPAKRRLTLPKPELLRPQGPPDCGEDKVADPQPTAQDRKGSARTAAAQNASAAELQPSPGGEPSDRDAEMAQRVKLEYERACYRQAEIQVRERLRQLQSSVSDTIKSINRAE